MNTNLYLSGIKRQLLIMKGVTCLFFLSLVLAGCAKDENSYEETNTIVSLEQTTWKCVGCIQDGNPIELANYDEKNVLSEKAFTISFLPDGVFSGFATVKELFGRYVTNGNDILITLFYTIDKKEDIVDEDYFRYALSNSFRYELNEKHLRLYFSDNSYLAFEEERVGGGFQ